MELMKKDIAMLGLISGMLGGEHGMEEEYNPSKTPLTPEQRARRKYFAYDSKMIKRGLKRYFFIDKETGKEVFVYAINYKNAMKKMNKGNFIIVGEELEYFKNKK